MKTRQTILSTTTLSALLVFAVATSQPKEEIERQERCWKACDPSEPGNAYKDQAYETAYKPCLDEAVKQGKTAEEMQCTKKATSACDAICTNDK